MTIRIRGHAEADAVHHARKTHFWLRHHVNISAHPGRDVLKLAFAEIGDRPPGARVNQREHLLTHMRVGAF